MQLQLQINYQARNTITTNYLISIKKRKNITYYYDVITWLLKLNPSSSSRDCFYPVISSPSLILSLSSSFVPVIMLPFILSTHVACSESEVALAYDA